MLKAIWFVVKLSVLLAGVIWLVERPGTVEINWQDYIIETSVGVLVAALLILFMVFTWFYRFWRGFVSVPAAVKRYRVAQAREQGYTAVTKGLVAIAAGDAHMAKKQSDRAQKLLPDTSLTQLLKAQTALMDGDTATARLEYMNLLEDKDAMFFGVRGLLNQALKDGDDQAALELIERAEAAHPKQDWILLTRLSIETRLRRWGRAEQTLTKAVRLGAINRDVGQHHRQAIWVAQSRRNERGGSQGSAMGFAKKAFKIDRGFVPAALQLAHLYGESRKQRAAVKTIEQAWALNPHPALAEMWMKLLPPMKKEGTPEQALAHRFKWMERLYNLEPHAKISNRVFGRMALEAKLWEKARLCLLKAEDYKKLADLERLEKNDEAAARDWLEKAADAPRPKSWVCDDCGFDNGDVWDVVCPHCHGFNVLEWQHPVGKGHHHTHAQGVTAGQALPSSVDIIEPPAKA